MYNFVFDRFRAIQQDIIVQNASGSEIDEIHRKMAYYLLRAGSLLPVDRHINRSFLMEIVDIASMPSVFLLMIINTNEFLRHLMKLSDEQIRMKNVQLALQIRTARNRLDVRAMAQHAKDLDTIDQLALAQNDDEITEILLRLKKCSPKFPIKKSLIESIANRTIPGPDEIVLGRYEFNSNDILSNSLKLHVV